MSGRNYGKPTCPGGTNPINIAVGNKYHEESLIPGHDSPAFSLHFNAYGPSPGTHWTTRYDAKVEGNLEHYVTRNESFAHEIPPALSAIVTRHDGRIYRFSNDIDWSSRNTVNHAWASFEPGVVLSLETVTDPQTGQADGYKLTTAAAAVEWYDLSGRLVRIDRAGQRFLTIERDNDNRIKRVVNEKGKALDYGYLDADRYVDRLTVAGHGSYGLLFAQGKLVAIVYPDETPGDDTDNPRRLYHYEDTRFPHYLTGITDENGHRAATWAYDDQGRAISSEHADGTDNYTVVYNADGTTTVTDPLGKQTTYHFGRYNGLYQVTRVAGHATATCPGANQHYDYDSNGFLIGKTDGNGQVTTYTRDDRGRELSRTEGVGTADARTITTTWHADFNKPLEVTEPGRLTTYSYDPDGRLRTKTEQAQP